MGEYTVDYLYIRDDHNYIKYIPIIFDTVYLLNKSGLKKLSEETCLTDLDSFIEFPINPNNRNKSLQFKITTNIFSNIKRGISLCPEKSINHITVLAAYRAAGSVGTTERK